MWPSGGSTRHVNCGLPPEFFFVAPASATSFQNHCSESGCGTTSTINFDSHSLSGSNAVGVGVGVIPLLTATPYLPSAEDEELLSNARNRGGMQLWQQQQQGQNSPAYLKRPMIADHANILPSRGGSASMGASTCRDCGNQAKKDCTHRRCRTCCKSRGYDCATHVRSTWVPAAYRRERQHMAGYKATSGAKKPRLSGASQTTTTASSTPPQSVETTSSHQESLPGQVRAPAVFKFVKMTAVDDGKDEYAYQAVVTIGGRIFKGFLYDQGFEGRESFPDMSDLHLGGGRNAGASSPPVLDPSEIYNASGSGFLGGLSFGNQ